VTAIIFINVFDSCNTKKQMMIFVKYLHMVKYIAHHESSSEQQQIVTDEKFAEIWGIGLMPMV
jgi:hypothetical protein